MKNYKKSNCYNAIYHACKKVDYASFKSLINSHDEDLIFDDLIIYSSTESGIIPYSFLLKYLGENKNEKIEIILSEILIGSLGDMSESYNLASRHALNAIEINTTLENIDYFLFIISMPDCNIDNYDKYLIDSFMKVSNDSDLKSLINRKYKN